MNKFLTFLFLALLFNGTFIISIRINKSKTELKQISSDTNLPLAVVYDGVAGCETCSQPIIDALLGKYRILKAGIKETISIKDALAMNPKVYIQPGGGDIMDIAWNDMKNNAESIRNYVANGGSYVGICMGAYLADGFLKDNEIVGLNLLEESGSYSDSYISLTNAEIKDTKSHLIDVKWNGIDTKMYYQYGPYFSKPTNTSSNSKIVGLYKNGAIAAFITNYKNGKVGVIGPHPEAPEEWLEEFKAKPVTHLFQAFVDETVSRN